MGFLNKWFGKKNNASDANGSEKKVSSKANEKKETKDSTGLKKDLVILSPIAGKIKFLSDVSDPVFAEEMTGKGIAIIPNKGQKNVYSPTEGIIKVAFPTGHAYGIKTEMGPELLVHIGIDTVELDGKGFIKKVEVDEKISVKTELCEIDIPLILKHEKEIDIIVIATNDSITNFEVKIEIENGADVKVGDPIFKIVQK